MSDRVKQIRELADGLLDQDSSGNERVQIRADAGMVLPIYLGRSFPQGRMAAIISGVSSEFIPPNYRKPTLKGLDIHWVDQDQKAGGKFDIVLELVNEDAVDIFILFVARICEDIEQADGRKNAVHRVLGQVDRWRNFFSGSSNTVLPNTKQTGLYGELLQIVEFCEAGLGTGYIFGAWTGSSATNQGFEFGPIAIEIKSTVANDTSEFAVSNIRQLDPTGLDNLYLFRVAFDVRQGSERTLPELVGLLRRLVKSGAPDLEIRFEENLLRSGYRDKHAEFYSQRSYTQRFRDQYVVRDDFPRLEETDIPSGVSGVKYIASLNGCEIYKVGFKKIVQEIGAQ